MRGLILGFLKLVKYKLLLNYRLKSRHKALEPSFFIIGVQKGGTTSLFKYLSNNPIIKVPLQKEIQFFNNRDFIKSKEGLNWYLAHFPSKDNEGITGESTPDYFDHPTVPTHLHALYPEAKLIVLLRDPIKRMYSHYRHRVRKGIEKKSFKAALLAEEERIKEDLELLKINEDYFSYNFHHFGYLYKSLYSLHIENWINAFGMKNMLFVKSEVFFKDPRKILFEIEQFLGIQHLDYSDESLRAFNTGNTNRSNQKKEELLEIPVQILEQIERDKQKVLKLTGIEF